VVGVAQLVDLGRHGVGHHLEEPVVGVVRVRMRRGRPQHLLQRIGQCHPAFEIECLMVDAVARHQLGDADGAERSVERTMEIAAPEGRAYMILTIPGAREVLQRHPAHRTAHPEHVKRLVGLLSGGEPAQALAEPLSDRELAVLRFLPTNLSAAEIGSELFLSVHTVKTHMRKLYAKLDVHTRAEAVQKGRDLGLLGTFTRIV